MTIRHWGIAVKSHFGDDVGQCEATAGLQHVSDGATSLVRVREQDAVKTRLLPLDGADDADDQADERECDRRLHEHRVLGSVCEWQHISRTERRRIREAEVQIVEKDRPPAGRREFCAQLLREGEVDRTRLLCPHDRPAAVHQPIEHPEREVVAEPDEGAGGKERPWRLSRALVGGWLAAHCCQSA